MLFAQVLVGASVALIMVPVLPQMQVYSARMFKVTDKEALVNRVTGKPASDSLWLTRALVCRTV